MHNKHVIAAIGNAAGGYICFYTSLRIGTVDLLPDWIFFVVVVIDLKYLAQEVPSAGLLRPLGIILSICYILRWGLSIFGITPEWHVLSVLLAILVLYFNFQLLTNLAEVARLGGCPQEGKILRLRSVQAILTTVGAIPVSWEGYPSTEFVLALVHLAIVVWICKVLFSLKKSLSLAYVDPDEI